MGMFDKWMVRNIFPACVKVGVKHTSFRQTFWVHLGSHEPMGDSGWALLRIRPWRHQSLPSHSSGAQWCRLVTWVLSKSWVPRHVSFVHSQRFLVLFSWDCSDLYLIYLWEETESILWNSLISYLTITSVKLGHSNIFRMVRLFN